MRIIILLISYLFLGQYCLSAGTVPDLVKYVNTLQGTNSKHELTRGNTYPKSRYQYISNPHEFSRRRD